MVSSSSQTGKLLVTKINTNVCSFGKHSRGVGNGNERSYKAIQGTVSGGKGVEMQCRGELEARGC